MRAFLFAALAIAIVACTDGTETAEDIDATVRAALSATQEARPTPAPTATPEPTYWPTVEDHEIGVAAAISRLPPDSSGYLRDGLRNAAEHSDAVYIAAQCVAGERMSSAGFRKFTMDAISNGSLGTAARDVIRAILAKADARVERGLPAAEALCERAYLYPESGAEATLASRLVSAAKLPSIASFLRETMRTVIQNRPAYWFDLPAGDEKPFLLRWLCGDGCELRGE